VPSDASPLGTADEQMAWQSMPAGQRANVDRVFANMGNAIAAYEKSLTYGESRFDRQARAIAANDASGQRELTTQEVNGLRVFIGNGQCVTCHNSPLLTDQAFHNTGVPPRDSPGQTMGALLRSPKCRRTRSIASAPSATLGPNSAPSSGSSSRTIPRSRVRSRRRAFAMSRCARPTCMPGSL
jgi:cytochrome c peroxidase